jgi:hypothetical protein
VRKFVV